MRAAARHLIFAFSLALLVGPPATGLRAAVPSAQGCTWRVNAPALALRGTLRFESLRGRLSEVVDPRSGRFVRRWDVAGLPESIGSDGTSAWLADWSGTVHRLDAAHARRVAATDAWFERHGWCTLDAASMRAVRRTQGGRTFDVVRTVPRGGVPIEIWLDGVSGLPDRTIVRLNDGARAPVARAVKIRSAELLP